MESTLRNDLLLVTLVLCVSSAFAAYDFNSLCRPLQSMSVDINCYLGSVKVDCLKPPWKTEARLKCKEHYRHPDDNPAGFNRMKCENGIWDHTLTDFVCESICGEKNVNTHVATPLVINGENSVQGEYPWVVGIYRNADEKEQICAGSIISENLILTAAHCFADRLGNSFPAKDYLIAAGKYYRKLGHPNDATYEQQRFIKRIVSINSTDRFYAGISRYYADDIVLIQLEKPLEFSFYIKPICLDRNEQISVSVIQRTNLVITGWGLTKSGGETSPELKVLKVPYINLPQCLSELPTDFKPFLTSGKFCAGYRNGSAICQGDSGGGLMATVANKYYIVGIASLAPGSGGSCDPNEYSLYTNVTYYTDWIASVEKSNNHEVTYPCPAKTDRNVDLLVKATADKKLETMEKLLFSCVNPNGKDENGNTPLILASNSGFYNGVELLLDYNPDLDAHNGDGSYQETALTLAADKGHAHIVSLLLERGAKVDEPNKGGWTPLMKTAQYGFTDVVKILLNKGANKEAHDGNNWTALLWACWNGHTKTAKTLIDYGANIKAVNKYDWSPVMMAARNGHMSTVQLLVYRGADVNGVNYDSYTALMMASANGYPDIVKVLLEAGADPKFVNRDNLTALSVANAAQKEDIEEYIKTIKPTKVFRSRRYLRKRNNAPY